MAYLADIIEILIKFIKIDINNLKSQNPKEYKGQKIEVERITNYLLKCSFHLYFPIKQKLLISGEKC